MVEAVTIPVMVGSTNIGYTSCRSRLFPSPLEVAQFPINNGLPLHIAFDMLSSLHMQFYSKHSFYSNSQPRLLLLADFVTSINSIV